MTSPTDEQVEAARMDRRARIDAAAGSLPAYLATATQEELERLIWDSQHQRNVFGFFKGLSSDHAHDVCSEIARRAALTAASEWRPIETAPQERVPGEYSYPRIRVWARGDEHHARWNDDRYSQRPRPYWSIEGFRTTESRAHQPAFWSPTAAPPAPDVGREG